MTMIAKIFAHAFQDIYFDEIPAGYCPLEFLLLLNLQSLRTSSMRILIIYAIEINAEANEWDCDENSGDEEGNE